MAGTSSRLHTNFQLHLECRRRRRRRPTFGSSSASSAAAASPTTALQTLHRTSYVAAAVTATLATLSTRLV
jgi:hypothetical protein